MRFVGARSRWTLMMLPDQALMLMKTKRLADGERRDSVKDEMGGDGREGKKRKEQMSRSARFMFVTF